MSTATNESVIEHSIPAGVVSVEEALEEFRNGRTTFFDLREEGEMRFESSIPGAVHVSRGMLDFLLDPTSPYYKPEFDRSRRIILYCTNGHRSAVVAQRLKEMGVMNVAHLAGGYGSWKDYCGPVSGTRRERMQNAY